MYIHTVYTYKHIYIYIYIYIYVYIYVNLIHLLMPVKNQVIVAFLKYVLWARYPTLSDQKQYFVLLKNCNNVDGQISYKKNNKKWKIMKWRPEFIHKHPYPKLSGCAWQTVLLLFVTHLPFGNKQPSSKNVTIFVMATISSVPVYLYLWIYIYIYVHICMYVHICTSIYIFIYMNTHI
jgi:hypothetical protein